MGVRGLNQYIVSQGLYRIKELVAIGRGKSERIKIIVDTNGIGRFLIDIALRKMRSYYDNEFLMLPVGEFKEMANIFKEFHECLQKINVELIWVVDGPKGTDKDTLEHKLTTWKDRQNSYSTNYKTLFEGCNLQKYEDILEDCRPIITFEPALENLKKCGAQVIYLPGGEADSMLVNIYKSEGAFAILTNDTDLVIFDKCNVILTYALRKHHGGDLKMQFVNQGPGNAIFQTPTKFDCPITDSKKIIDSLQLDGRSQLMMLAVMVGNDYTSKFASSLSTLCDIKNGHIKDTANYIKTKNISLKNYANSMDLRSFVSRNPEFQNAVAYSMNFYSLNVVFTNETSDELSSFLNEGLQRGVIQKECISIHNGIFFDYIAGEELPEACEGIMATLGNLRAQVYPFLLKKDHDHVREVLYKENVVRQVVHSDRKANLILESEGLERFVAIFSDGFSDIFKNYVTNLRITDNQKLFVFCIVSYFYKITYGINLKLNEFEFKAIFITAFFQFKFENENSPPILDNETFMRLKICPSPRCITCATWIMNIYHTAAYICGGALNIRHLFPQPAAIMKGSVLFAFFETMNNDGQRVRHVEGNIRNAIKSLINDIMVEYQEIYDLITHGII